MLRSSRLEVQSAPSHLTGRCVESALADFSSAVIISLLRCNGKSNVEAVVTPQLEPFATAKAATSKSFEETVGKFRWA
jgi:hypothetical protein